MATLALCPWSHYGDIGSERVKAGSFVGTRAGLSHDVKFFSYARAMNMNGFEMTLLALRTSESGAISIIFELAIHRFNN